VSFLLAIDIGNTNITVGVFLRDKIVADWRLSSRINKTSDEFSLELSNFFTSNDIDKTKINDLSLCSVVPTLTDTIVVSLKSLTNQEPLIVGPGTRTGIQINYDRTQDVGADRIANAVAVNHIYGNPAIVIDMGTATVFDVMIKGPKYIGGAIAPGIQVSAEAIARETSQLPKVELVAPPNVIGKNTIESIQSGFVYGFVHMIEGMTKRIKTKIHKNERDLVKVIATGGLAHIITPHTNIFYDVNKDLTLHGLRIIKDINQKDNPVK
jgi:type III pantothenate kinase|tara:strand:- start:3650 stop:4450 length:801 start_codon:yes stop_codon:yes gene_type:complete